jgi:hypothetical protein
MNCATSDYSLTFSTGPRRTVVIPRLPTNRLGLYFSVIALRVSRATFLQGSFGARLTQRAAGEFGGLLLQPTEQARGPVPSKQ